MQNRIALRVDVDTLRGTLVGVPALLDLLVRHRVDATFLFSLGPDHTGRALRRLLRPGFLEKVWRTSVPAHYGLKTLLYGTLLPGPDISRRARDAMRAVPAAGFEAGVHCYDHVLWQDRVRHGSESWTRRQMEQAVAAFQRVFAASPEIHAAAGWQLNSHVPQLEAELGFRYASDTRGTTPFRAVIDGTAASCPQLPTTLPTFDEVIGMNGCTEHNVADVLLQRSLHPARFGHVFTLHAELEGMRLLPAFERLLHHWREHALLPCSMRDMFLHLPPELPRHVVEFREFSGRCGLLACQGAAATGTVHAANGK